jgi:hypothetical protein
LIYNLGDVCGRVSAGFKQLIPNTPSGHRALLFFVMLRAAFTPLFLFCNVAPSDGNTSSMLSLLTHTLTMVTPQMEFIFLVLTTCVMNVIVGIWVVLTPFFVNDAWFMIFMFLFSASAGYLGVHCMAYGPSLVASADQDTAGTIMVC